MQSTNPMIPRSERQAVGRARRESLPRSAHAQWIPDPNRPSVIDMLNRSNQDRLTELIPLRHERMARSPLACFRGLAAAMAYDLAHIPNTGMLTPSCGDCHLQNFGWFGTPERNLIFDITDFDESLPAPWEWDLKRLAVSFVLAAKRIGAKDSECKEFAQRVVQQYREHLTQYENFTPLDMWYARVDATAIGKIVNDHAISQRLSVMFDRARTRTMEALLPKLTEQTESSTRILEQPPLVFHPPQVDGYLREVELLLSDYRKSLTDNRENLFDRYSLVDAAYKVVGVGSVGLRCSVMLLMDADKSPLLLQLKEARASVLEPYLQPSSQVHHGLRIVQGQRAIQAASDMFLGWTSDSENRHYYVRQLRDMKLSVDVESFSKAELLDYSKLCGWALARAQAKTGDASSILGYMGTGEHFDIAIGEFAIEYASQVDRDFETLTHAVSEGQIPVH